MSWHARTFLAGFVGLLFLGTLGWWGWQVWSRPTTTITSLFSLRAPRGWESVDVTSVPEQSRPLYYVQPKGQPTNRLVLIRRENPPKNEQELLTETLTTAKVQNAQSAVVAKGYLQEKEKQWPFVHVTTGQEDTVTGMITTGSVTYFLTASFNHNEADTFGEHALQAMRSLRAL